MTALRLQRLSLALLSLLLVTGLGCRKPKKTSEPGAKSPAASDKPQDERDDEEPATATEEPPSDKPEAKPEPAAPESPVELALSALTHADAKAADAVGKLEAADRLTVLQKALESGNLNASLGALRILSAKGTPELKDELIRTLKSPTERIRMAALDTIAASDRRALLPAVLGRLQDELPEVRATACDALRTMQASGDETLKTVMARLSDPADVVRAACSDAFARLPNSVSLRDTIGALLIGESVPAREGALRVLAVWGSPPDLDLVRGRLADENESVVVAALAAVSRFAGAAAVKELERFVKDQRVAVRVEAVAGFERQPKDLVKNSLYEAMKDNSEAVRIEASAQLSRYPEDPETFIRLHSLLRDDSVGVRASAAIALAELGDARSFKPVAEQLEKEQSAQVRVDLWRTLAAADRESALPKLIEALGKTKKEEKSAILVALRAITGQTLSPKAEDWQAWLKTRQPAPAPE